VLWFNWYNGDPDAGRHCDCGDEAGSPGKGWWVPCSQVRPGCPPERGACCLLGVCGWTTRRVCDARGGVYMGNGVSCEEVCGCGDGWHHEDVDRDGDVDFDDFLRVLNRWGEAGDDRPAEDLDGDCNVGIHELLRVFENWGPPPPPRGACCTDEVCDLVGEVACDARGGIWWGDGSRCSEVSCVDAPELGDALCNCDGEYRVGDRVTMLRNAMAPGLEVGVLGTVVCADNVNDGGWPGKVAVLWDNWIEARADRRENPTNSGTWLCDCGWIPFLERWSTAMVYCEDLLRGEHDIEMSGACCIDGDWCRMSTPNSCADWGGVYAGDGSPCRPEVCDGPVDCACDGVFRIGEQVRLTQHVDYGARLRLGRTGHVFGANSDDPHELLVYFDRVHGGVRRSPVHDCGYQDNAADRLDYTCIHAVPCGMMERVE
jgi:hypothetical protein